MFSHCSNELGSLYPPYSPFTHRTLPLPFIHDAAVTALECEHHEGHEQVPGRRSLKVSKRFGTGHGGRGGGGKRTPSMSVPCDSKAKSGLEALGASHDPINFDKEIEGHERYDACAPKGHERYDACAPKGRKATTPTPPRARKATTPAHSARETTTTKTYINSTHYMKALALNRKCAFFFPPLSLFSKEQHFHIVRQYSLIIVFGNLKFLSSFLGSEEQTKK